MNFVEELRWRGILHDIMPGTEDLLNKGMVSGYIGFDPTSDSLHVGSLAQIMTLIHFQRAGHKPFALVGGATGMVGDPSGKSAERNLLSENVLQKNQAGIKGQLEKFLNFECGSNSAEMVNNYDWFKDFTFLDFIRDVGKHITVNYMMAKDSVKNRISGDTGMSFTEFSYQLVQGYDFYYLWKNKNCMLQMGGSDQWGNIVTGTEFIRRKGAGEAFALTTQLIKKSDGTKFGKSEGGNIWLDAEKTSPYQFYQFWLNASDEDAKSYVRIFTLFDQSTIEDLETEHFTAPHLRALQKALAKDITVRVHGEAEYEKAIKSSDFFFGDVSVDFLHELKDKEILNLFSGVPNFNVSFEDIKGGINIIDLLATKTSIFPSKGEAKKMIVSGGVSINKEKVTSVDSVVNELLLINGKYIMAQKGRRNYFLILVHNVPTIFWKESFDPNDRINLDSFFSHTSDFYNELDTIPNINQYQKQYVKSLLGTKEELIDLLENTKSTIIYRSLRSLNKLPLEEIIKLDLEDKLLKIIKGETNSRVLAIANTLLNRISSSSFSSSKR